MTERTISGDAGFRAQLAGFSLTTAEILYRLPDHPSLLQTYIWQEYDSAPRFPKLQSFLDFWIAKLDGKLFRVTVAFTVPGAPTVYGTGTSSEVLPGRYTFWMVREFGASFVPKSCKAVRSTAARP